VFKEYEQYAQNTFMQHVELYKLLTLPTLRASAKWSTKENHSSSMCHFSPRQFPISRKNSWSKIMERGKV